MDGDAVSKALYIEENENILDAAIERLLSGERPLILELGKSQFSRERELVLLLSLFHARFKHGAFREEQEWRLSFKRHHKPMRHQRFRPSRTMLVPYIEAELNKNMKKEQIVEGEYIREVIIGPAAHAELNKQAVEQFLLSLGRGSVRVVMSSTPYRDW